MIDFLMKAWVVSRMVTAAWALPASFALMFGVPGKRVAQSFAIAHICTVMVLLDFSKDEPEPESDTLNKPARYDMYFIGVPREAVDDIRER